MAGGKCANALRRYAVGGAHGLSAFEKLLSIHLAFLGACRQCGDGGGFSAALAMTAPP